MPNAWIDAGVLTDSNNNSRSTPYRNQKEVRCRATCNATETVTRIIQGCFRTHGDRAKRHYTRWEVSAEHRIETSDGLRKPDYVRTKDDRVFVIH